MASHFATGNTKIHIKLEEHGPNGDTRLQQHDTIYGLNVKLESIDEKHDCTNESMKISVSQPEINPASGKKDHAAATNEILLFQPGPDAHAVYTIALCDQVIDNEDDFHDKYKKIIAMLEPMVKGSYKRRAQVAVLEESLKESYKRRAQAVEGKKKLKEELLRRRCSTAHTQWIRELSRRF
jgi:hypothetical protein